LAAILSHVEKRQVTNDYTVRWDGKFYQIDRRDVRPGMRKAWVRVEQRLDGNIAVRFQDDYLHMRRCAQPLGEERSHTTVQMKPPQPPTKPKRKPDWMNNFSLRSGPSLRQAVRISNARS
jgi:hypothetical protein